MHSDRDPDPHRAHTSTGRRRPRPRRLCTKIAAAVVVPVLALALLSALWPSGRERLQADVGAAIRAVAPTQAGGEARMLDARDGYLDVGASLSPFASEPALTNLATPIREALLRAANDAHADGIELRVNSGWRSARYQQTLLDRAMVTYGSVEVARQYVKPPTESSHVTGAAVDIGPGDAASWLTQHGGRYGLCQIYANESWHFELATEPGATCPVMVSDAAGAR